MEHMHLLQSSEIIYLPVDQITPNPFQPRIFFDRDNLDELCKSIQEFGILQPISVRLINGVRYELVAGERRLRASKLAGLSTIPAIVVTITDQQSAILAIIENLQRQNLNYIEEAQGFQNLIHDYSFTQEELAQKMGKSQSTIANKMRILRLPSEVIKVLLENDCSERHARALLKLENEEDQLLILHRVIKEGLTVKRTEDLIENLLSKQRLARRAKMQSNAKRHVKDIRIFTNTIKQAVDIMVRSGVDTNYEVKESDDGYEITIKIKS